MNLKEKVSEAKIFDETKTKLLNLIKEFLIEHKKYSQLYNELFTKWKDDLISEFKTTFTKEGFSIQEENKKYSGAPESYIKAILYDLEFELLVDSSQVRFLQNKPTIDKKNILLKPSVKEYNIHYIEIGEKGKAVSSIYDFNKVFNDIDKAEYSIVCMQEFYDKLNREMNILLDEMAKIGTVEFANIAIQSDNYSFKNVDKSIKFESFNEFIEQL